MTMRRVLLALAIVLVFAARAFAGWYSGAVLTNPTANTVVVDTGAYTPTVDFHPILVFVWATAASDVAFQHVAANGTTVLRQQVFHVTATTALFLSIPVLFGAGERLRIIMQSGVTGNVQGSIIFS